MAMGTPVAPRSITLTGNGEARRVHEDEITAVDYGRYTIEVNAPGASQEVQSVIINQVDQIVAIAMRPGRI